MDIRTPQGRPIIRWEDWTRPKRDYQWKEGRSAMELAKAWFRAGRLAVPREISSLLDSEPRFDGLVFQEAVPELVTRLPERGEGRNHDLWLLGRTKREQVTVCVEAKADESFGNHTVGEYLDHCLRRRQRGISTRAPERIEALLHMVDAGWKIGRPSPWLDIPYQLLTAACGTILQARLDSSDVAVLVVHVFETAATTKLKLDANAAAFAQFIGVLTGAAVDTIEPERLFGPVTVHGIEIYSGKSIA